VVTLVRRFWADETGATAIEYALIAAGIALVIFAPWMALVPTEHQIHIDQQLAEIAIGDVTVPRSDAPICRA
jgi:Flp pilus assembly pilin Flp